MLKRRRIYFSHLLPNFDRLHPRGRKKTELNFHSEQWRKVSNLVSNRLNPRSPLFKALKMSKYFCVSSKQQQVGPPNSINTLMPCTRKLRKKAQGSLFISHPCYVLIPNFISSPSAACFRAYHFFEKEKKIVGLLRSSNR